MAAVVHTTGVVEVAAAVGTMVAGIRLLVLIQVRACMKLMEATAGTEVTESCLLELVTDGIRKFTICIVKERMHRWVGAFG